MEGPHNPFAINDWKYIVDENRTMGPFYNMYPCQNHVDSFINALADQFLGRPGSIAYKL